MEYSEGDEPVHRRHAAEVPHDRVVLHDQQVARGGRVVDAAVVAVAVHAVVQDSGVEHILLAVVGLGQLDGLVGVHLAPVESVGVGAVVEGHDVVVLDEVQGLVAHSGQVAAEVTARKILTVFNGDIRVVIR